jgi:predicted nucleic acid-binding protein
LKLVLDTNIYCDYAEGLPEVVDAIATHGQYLFIPSIVIGELHYGFMKGSRQRFNEKKLRQMISRLKIEIINVDTEVARKYALIYLFLQKKGAKIPTPLPGLRPEEVAPSGQP